jgi:hypothetical protein
LWIFGFSKEFLGNLKKHPKFYNSQEFQEFLIMFNNVQEFLWVPGISKQINFINEEFLGIFGNVQESLMIFMSFCSE